MCGLVKLTMGSILYDELEIRIPKFMDWLRTVEYF